MSLFNRLIVASIPLVPLPIVRRMASNYIAGETLQDAVRTVQKLNAEGATATLDVLGEDVTTGQEAAASRDQSIEALRAVARGRLDSGLSIKLTSLGLKIDKGLCTENVRGILRVAAEQSTFVRVDMEDSSCTSDTLEVFRIVHAEFPLTGIVVQAYLRRTAADIAPLVEQQVGFRLCKGIYREPEALAFQDRAEVQQNYLRLLETMLRGGSPVGIATHDEVLVEGAERLIADLGVPRDRYEFQMLLGVRPELRRKVLAAGHRLRVYVPYGANWYGYSTRRFKENPVIAGYVFRALFHRG